MQLKQNSGGLIYSISGTISNGSNVDVRPVEVWLMQSCRLAAHLKKKKSLRWSFKILPHCQSSSDRHCRCFTMILSPRVEDAICHPVPPRKRTSRCKQVSGRSGTTAELSFPRKYIWIELYSTGSVYTLRDLLSRQELICNCDGNVPVCPLQVDIWMRVFPLRCTLI